LDILEEMGFKDEKIFKEIQNKKPHNLNTSKEDMMNIEDDTSICFGGLDYSDDEECKFVPERKEEKIKKEVTDKPLILLDGSNVAIKYGKNKRFISKGIAIAVEYWKKLGHKVTVILPDYCFSED